MTAHPRGSAMLRPLQWLMLFATRFLLGLRYRVRVVGTREAKARPGPYLILPNHPAYMDPPNVIRALWGAFKVRPMLLETNFESPVLAPFAWLLGAIKVPDLDRASAEARERTEAAVKTVIAALKAGDNVILWPSGTLSRNGTDVLGAARTAADVLAAVPETTVVLVRTRGLWGSSFSWGYDATKPRLIPLILSGVKTLLANLVLLTPRRKLTMTLQAFTKSERPEPVREKLNPWLEAWYNADAPETPTFVPYHFAFGPRTREFPPPPAAAGVDAGAVPAAVKEAVAHIVEEVTKRPLGEVRADTTFAALGIDSLEGMEIALRVEQQFGFTADTVPTSIGGLWALAAGQLAKGPPKPPPAAWFAPPSDTAPLEILGETLPAAFLARATRHPKDVAVADDLSGVLNYERLLIGSLTMASRFRDLPGANVGLLLPASVGCDLGFFGLHLAGKLPILLNWTTGPGSLAHAAKLMGLSHVVTSKAFIDRTRIEVPGTAYVFLEDLRGTVGKLELLRRLVAVRYFPGSVVRKTLAALPDDPHRHAVVLFTSGSEKAPKAVPLTHANLIADLRGATPIAKVTRADSVLGFLPMFHSFGLSIAGLFPLLAGAKVVHHPDPTDSTGLARKAVGYKTTLILATPTFVNVILDKVQPGELDSAREFIIGAEKCPPHVFEKAAKLAPNAQLLEGYGVTECSPCVSLNPWDAAKHGSIGVPLKGVEVCVVDLDSGEVVPAGTQGMLLVAGPTVFPGYLGENVDSPFRELNGKRWYVTGDLATLDADGYIHFKGRLKRFLKAGGEMISLPALEEPLARLYPPTDDGPQVAVEGIETEGGGRRVVLFTTLDIPLKDANAVLSAEGFRGVMRLEEVRKVDKIPVLGTGKTDYKVLRGLLAS